MKALLILALAPALLAQAPPPAAKAKAADPCAARPQLYIAAMGEPFRSAAGDPDPMAAWFAQADRDHNGRITLAEFVADADRFFAKLDRNHDGEIDPGEVIAYESEIAPEIRIYQRGAPLGDAKSKRRARKAGDGDDYGGALGAGRFAQLNIPEPVASADQDFNRGVSRDEFRSTATRRFALLDAGHAGALTPATLARTPEQARLADCAAGAANARKR